MVITIVSDGKFGKRKISVHSCGATHVWDGEYILCQCDALDIIGEPSVAKFQEWDWWRVDDIEEKNDDSADN